MKRAIAVGVIRTDEESMFAQHTLALVRPGARSERKERT
jgi:hypothetical protein